MPKLASAVKGVDTSDVEAYAPYEGAQPTPGYYTAVIQSAKVQLTKRTPPAPMIRVVWKLKADPQDSVSKKQFDGAPLFSYVTTGETPQEQARMASFLKAVAGDDGAEIIFEDIENGGAINKIGKKSKTALAATKVTLIIKSEMYNDVMRPSVDAIIPWRASVVGGSAVAGPVTGVKVAPTTPSAPAETHEDETEEGDEGEWDRSARNAELGESSLADLKALLAEYELDIKGPRAKLTTAILDHEQSLVEETEEDTEDDEQAVADAEELIADEVGAMSIKDLRAAAEALGLEKMPAPKLRKAVVDARIAAEIHGEDTEDADASDEALTEDSTVEALVAALVEAGYDIDDLEDYDDSTKDELVEMAREEGLLAVEDETPF